MFIFSGQIQDPYLVVSRGNKVNCHFHPRHIFAIISITIAGNASEPFSINSTSGEITTTEPLRDLAGREFSYEVMVGTISHNTVYLYVRI